MRIVLPGGSGQVGAILARAFHAEGHSVTVLSRDPAPAPWRVVAWDARSKGAWHETIDGADVVINLAGRNVNCRYTPANRAAILHSRVESTRAVGQAIAEAAHPPAIWLQASTATIYAHTFGPANDEAGAIGGNEPDAPPNWRFSIEVATAWEAALNEADTPRTRRVALRSAMVMSPDQGGIFDALVGLARKGLGGSAAGGRQFVSWIHDLDFIASIRWLIDRPDVTGPVNLSSPNPLPYRDFMRELRTALGIRVGLPATRWMLAIGARLMGSETELVLKSRRVVPGRLLADGFSFRFPEWSRAVADLAARLGSRR